MTAGPISIEPTLPLGIVALAGILMSAFVVWRMFRARDRRVRVWWIFRLVMVLLSVVVVIRPVIPATTIGPVATGGTEVYFLVDTTTSMAAEDVGGEVSGRPGTRLDGVKSDIEQIATGLVGAQFALITFDSAAQQRVPLTSDQSALVSASRAMSPEISSYSRGSSIDEGLELTTQILDDAEVERPDAQRVLFYFGDGEQTRTGQVPADFAGLAPALSNGAVLGYGTAEGGPMRIFDGFPADDVPSETLYLGDPDTGGLALSVIDETNLRTIAVQLDVDYLRRAAGEPIDPAIAGIDVAEVTVTQGAPPTPGELYWIAAGGLAVLLIAEATSIVLAVARLRPMARGSVPGGAR